MDSVSPAGHVSKICGHCSYTLPLSQFDGLQGADDGLMPYCKPCVARNPWLVRSPCERCGSSRLLSKFPGGDTTRPCTVCEPHARTDDDSPVLLALRSADLVRGEPKTAAELLEDIGYYDATRSDVIAAAKWLAASRFEQGRRSAEKVFYVGVRGLDPEPLQDLLDDLDDMPSGRLTVTEFLREAGLRTEPSKGELNMAARWLRDEGFREVRKDGRRVFDLGDEEGDDDTFSRWAHACPDAVQHLRLSDDEHRRLAAGCKPTQVQRLAMSALLAGLPPYE